MTAGEIMTDETIQEQAPQGFVVDDLKKATWCFRKIQALTAHINEVKAVADTEFNRIKAWQDKETNADNKSIEYLKNLLAEYYSKEKAENSKFKLSTPYGSGYVRKNAPELVFDENAVNQLEQMGLNNLVKVEKTVRKADFKKLVTVTDSGAVVMTDDGEVLDFVQAVPKPDTFVVKGVD